MIRHHKSPIAPPPKNTLTEVTEGKENALKVLKFLHDEGLSRKEASMALACACYNIELQKEDAAKAALEAKVTQAEWR